MRDPLQQVADPGGTGAEPQREPVKRLVHDLVHSYGGSVSAEHGIGRLKVADLELDPSSMRASRAGLELSLSPIGLKLLTILMRESPRVVSRQEIEREIWGNSLPDSDTLRSHLYNVRKAVDKNHDRQLLHTVQSAGYRIADVQTSI